MGALTSGYLHINMLVQMVISQSKLCVWDVGRDGMKMDINLKYHSHVWLEPNLHGFSLKTGKNLVTNAQRKCRKCGMFQKLTISYKPKFWLLWKWYTINHQYQKAWDLGQKMVVQWEDGTW